MDEKEIKLYLQLNKRAKFVPAVWGLMLFLVVANMIFPFTSYLSFEASIVFAPILAVAFTLACFGESQSAKAVALINKLVNSNPEFIRQISEYKKA